MLLAAAFIALTPMLAIAEKPPAGKRPNILWITCEDMSPMLGCYGDAQAVTPSLDRLARQGVRYTNAFASASVCTPARSTLITGVYASSLGTQHLRGPMPLPDSVRCFTEYLREAGYHCTNNVKEDYNFATPKTAWDESSNKAHWRSRRPGQPFFAVFNLFVTHQSQVRLPDAQFAQRTQRLTDEQRHDPSAITLPPYYPDTPVVRRDVARMYDLGTAMDYQVQELLDQLDQDGLTDDTIVFFYADHGTGLPRHKRWLYDSGLRVPLLIRFPAKFEQLAPAPAGKSVDRLVSFVDFAPTVLSLAGLDVPAAMQGSAFLGPQSGPPREYVYAIRDRVDECMEMSRAVGDGRYKYIRHFMLHRPVMQHSDFSERTPLRQELRRLDAAGELTGPPAQLMRPHKDAEQLFDTQADPHELNNLVDAPEYCHVLADLRSELDHWMIETRDTGLTPEIELRRLAAERLPFDAFREEAAEAQLQTRLDAADLVGRGPDFLDDLVARLDHADPAVRFWAVTGLAVLGLQAKSTADRLAACLDDDSPSVRFAAAEALCTLGQTESALPVLVAGLSDSDECVRLHAAMTLVAVGPHARDAAEPMRRVLAGRPQGNFPLYTHWALQHALRCLERP